jgi:hypothetical protein
MGRFIKVLLFLILIGLIGLVGFAYLGDLEPAQTEVTQPVILNAP